MEFFSAVLVPVANPCEPSPCGLNTICTIKKNKAVCSCLPDFIGDPLTSCQPECLMNSDCPFHQACLGYRCKDPCSFSNICGLGAVCSCKEHTVTCNCREGFTGDPFIQCIPERKFLLYSLAGIYNYDYYYKFLLHYKYFQ